MKDVRKNDKVKRVTNLDDIVRIVKTTHPHVVGQTILRRIIEGQRIESALRTEVKTLSYCLLVRTDEGGQSRSGVLIATPRATAGDMFANYGPAPIFFGFLFGFAIYDDFRVVFDEVLSIAHEQSCTTIHGPVEVTINYAIGLAEAPSPFPPSFLMPENPIIWNEWFNRFGMRVEERLFTFEAELSRLNLASRRRRLTDEATLLIESIVPPFTAKQRKAIVEVFNSGWSKNWGFVPIDEAGVAKLEKEFRMLLWEGLAHIAWLNGQPAAILIAIPDINEVFRAKSLPGAAARALRLLGFKKVRALKILILGLSGRLHGSALGLALVERLLNAGRRSVNRYGITHIQMGWTLESNRRINRLISRWSPDAQIAVHRVWRYDLVSDGD